MTTPFPAVNCDCVQCLYRKENKKKGSNCAITQIMDSVFPSSNSRVIGTNRRQEDVFGSRENWTFAFLYIV
jgi:hypothetical protein